MLFAPWPNDDNAARCADDCFIGTTAAIILGAAAAGGQLAGAKIASNSAHDAAKTQTDAGDHALAVQQQQYQQAQQRLQPYQQMGTTALGRLGQIAGGQPSAPPMSQPPMKYAGSGSTLGAMGQPPAPMAGLAGQTPQFVMMRAPTGETAQIPAAQVEHFRAKGAMVIQ